MSGAKSICGCWTERYDTSGDGGRNRSGFDGRKRNKPRLGGEVQEASPPASRWLSNYPYKVGLHGWFFGLAGLITLAIVVLTVGMQSWKAAKANPILSLKSE